MTEEDRDFLILQKCAVDGAIEGLGFEETTGMVSNSLKISQEEVVKALDRLRREKADDPEYKKLRKDLPKNWPV